MASEFEVGQKVHLVDSPALVRLAERELWVRHALRCCYVFVIRRLVQDATGMECAEVRSPVGTVYRLPVVFFCKA